MVDPGRVRSLLDRLAEELSHLRALAARDPAALLADPDLLAAVKYRSVVAIETCIDLAQHVIASEGLRAPAGFADAFTALGEAGFVGGDLIPALQSMARFRKLLVHGYLRVDDERVVEVLRARLGGLEAFGSQVARSALEEGGGT